MGTPRLVRSILHGVPVDMKLGRPSCHSSLSKMVSIILIMKPSWCKMITLGNPPGLHMFLNPESSSWAVCNCVSRAIILLWGIHWSPASYITNFYRPSYPLAANLFRYGFSSKRCQKHCKYFGYRSSHCVYDLSHIHQYVADDDYRLMGLTGSGMSHVRDMSYINFRVFTWFKDYRHPYQPTWQTCRLSLSVMHAWDSRR